MNSCTCINSASFSWFVLFSIPNKRSPVVKLLKFSGKCLVLASTNIGQTKKKWLELSKPSHWHVGSGTMFFLYRLAFSELHLSLIRVWKIEFEPCVCLCYNVLVC